MKTCNHCNQTKPLDEFGNAKTYAGGKRPQCKPCFSKYKASRLKPGDKAKWMRKHMYGLAEEDYNTMLAEQGGNCAICDASMDTPHVDHCHTTGKVRGLLCKLCNAGLGQFQDDTARLARAIVYLTGRV